MAKLIAITLLGILLFLTLIIYGLIILTYRKEKLDKNIILDSFSYYIGLAENAISFMGDIQEDESKVNKLVPEVSIIQHRSIYNVDYTVGKLFSNTHSITTDIPNEEIVSMCDNTIEEILKGAKKKIINVITIVR